MASNIDKLVVDIQLDIAQLKSGLASAKGEIKSFGSTLDSQKTHTDKFSSSMKSLGKTMLAGFAVGAIVSGLKAASEAAAADAESQAQLARQMKVTTGATDAQVAGMESQIEAMSNAAGVVDDEIRPSLAAFIRTTGDQTKALAMQKLALDVSAGTGKSLAVVQAAMSKAYQGNTAALNKLVPGITNAKDKMGALKTQFAGAAKTAADANPYKTMKVTLDNLKESIGAKLGPILKIVANLIQKLGPIIKIVVDNFGKLMKIIAPFIDQLLKKLAPIFTKIMNMFMGLAMKILPPVMKVILKLVPIIEKLLPPIQRLIDKLLPPLLKLFESLMPILDIIIQYIGDYLIPIISFFAEKLADGLTPIIEGLTNAFDFLADILKPVWDFMKPMLDGLLALMGVKIEPTVKVKTDTTELDAAATKTDDLDSSSLDLTGSTGTTGTTAAKKDEALTKYLTATNKDILKAQKDYQAAVKKANQDYAQSVQNQINDFRGAFSSATATSISDIYSKGAQSADAMANALKDRLAKIQQLAKDAAALSAAGYSAEFIKEVMAAGPDMGDQMTKSLLNGTPEQQKQIQDLFGATKTASETGVDNVAEGLRGQFTSGADALNDALLGAHKNLDKTLTTIQKGLNTKLAKFGGNLKTYATEIAGTKGILAGATKVGKTTGAPVVTGGGTNINITNNNNTNASPAEIAQQTVSSIKFGLPTTTAATGTSL